MMACKSFMWNSMDLKKVSNQKSSVPPLFFSFLLFSFFDSALLLSLMFFLAGSFLFFR